MNWHNATMCSPNLILITLYIIDPKATTNSFSLSLHDALPICHRHGVDQPAPAGRVSSRLGARVGERRKTGLGEDQPDSHVVYSSPRQKARPRFARRTPTACRRTQRNHYRLTTWRLSGRRIGT